MYTVQNIRKCTFYKVKI